MYNRTKKEVLAIFAVSILAAAGPAFSQALPNAQDQASAPAPSSRQPFLSGFQSELRPTGFLPLGADADLFSFGFGGDAGFSWRISALPLITLGADSGYVYLPSLAPGTTLSVIHLAAELGLRFQLARNFSASLSGDAGWFFARLNEGGAEPGSNPFLSGGLSLDLDLSRTWGLGIGAEYRSYPGLASGLAFGLSLSLSPETTGGGAKGLKDPGIKLLKGDGAGIDPVGISLNTVYPVFYAYYDTNPIGKLYLKNLESVEASDIVIKVLVKQFMDEAKTSISIDRLAAGATVGVDVMGLFSDRILSNPEGTKVPMSLVIQYRQFGKTVNEEYVETIYIGDRNSLVWDDDRKAAAFVSSKDPEALRLSRLIGSSVNDSLIPGVNAAFQKAMAVHESLRLLKLKYQGDPSSAIATGSRTTVDFLQFPQQTLDFKTGDCDDLSILYASLLEALGLRAAFITVPGHILVAVDTGLGKEKVASIFANPGDFIEQGSTYWIPIETTVQDKDFSYAWEEGARLWRAGLAKNAAVLIPVREAWNSYPPVVLPGAAESIELPAQKAVTAGYKGQWQAIVAKQIGSRASALLAQAKKTGDPVVYNRLGVLYARFGEFDKAEAQFTASLQKKETAAAYFNLGNLEFARGRYAESLAWCNKALKKDPDDARFLIAIARIQNELGRADAAKVAFDKAKAIAPLIAEQYSYLGQSGNEVGRAASADEAKRSIEWSE